MIRRASTFNTDRIDHIYQDPHDPNRKLFLHYGDLSDGSMLARILADIQPDELYNLGAQSHVAVSFDMPEYTTDVTGLGTLRLLEAVREAKVRPRIYQASSSEMYGNSPGSKTEQTHLDPLSPYAAAKAFAHQCAGIYRSGYDMFIARGMLFNHESPRRGPTFATRKITMGIAAICAGKQQHLFMGNLEAKRDWGYAPEFVEGMWMMLQADQPDDFVLATGRSYSVREFCEICFSLVGRDWLEYVRVDERYMRPVELEDLLGDASHASELLGWRPQVGIRGLAEIMLHADLAALGLDPADHLREHPTQTKPDWARRP